MLGVGRLGPLAAFVPAGEVGTDVEAWGSAVGAVSAAPPGQAEREAIAVLTSVERLGPVTLAGLLDAFGSAVAVLDVAVRPNGARRLVAGWRDARRDPHRIDESLARGIVAAARAADEILAPIRAEQLTLLTLDDPAYPARLRAIELPPPILYVRGPVAALSAERAIAVVGTRRPTDAGRMMAARIASRIARTGALVVSGLAVGIDGAAHAAVVHERAATVAVLGGGHARLFPRLHRQLADDILEHGGAVISEQSPRTTPERWTFPRRNRIIAGLTEATVVVEAGRGSGALITAAWALEQGRGCFLVPGLLGAPASEGCLTFLRDYEGVARIVAGVPELLEDLALVEQSEPAESATGRGRSRPRPVSVEAILADVGGTAAAVGRAVARGRATVDELVEETDLAVATVLASLTILEDHGLIVGAYGRYRASGGLASTDPESGRPRRPRTSRT